MAADGSIIIDSKIDTGGVKKGTADINQQFDSMVQHTKTTAAEINAAVNSIHTEGVADGMSASFDAESNKIQEILNDTERSSKSKAMSIAAVYRKQGMSQQEAMQKAWAQIERTSSAGTRHVKDDLRDIGQEAKAVSTQMSGDMNSALGGLNSVVKRLGASIAAAFSVATIVQFAKESVEASMQLSNALQGLRSIVEGQGRSFSDAQKFIEEYTSDGLIPATNAITAYKNLAARGYDDSQIRQVMIALKDASAFGRQASYTMGEAVQSATEGLKNENSVLVDNAGVTKNVAKMWEEYAESIGTTSANLTQQQKIQAEVNGILEESKYQAGDAEKVAGTLSGQLSQLSFNFEQLKVSVGDAIAPIVEAVLPTINAAIEKLTEFANAFAAVIRTLTGTTATAEDLADGCDNVTESVEDLTDATMEAGKAAKKALAPFDEITKFSATEIDTASSGAVGGLPQLGSVSEIGNLSEVAQESSEIAESWVSIAESGKAFYYEVLGEASLRNAANLNASLTNLSSGLKNFVSTFGEGGEFSLSEFLADSVDTTILTTAGIFKTFGGLLDFQAEFQRYFSELDKDVDPLDVSALGAIFGDKDVWDALGETISGIGMAITANLPEDGMFGLTKEEWENLFLPITEEYTNLFKGLSADASEALSDFNSKYAELSMEMRKISWGEFVITKEDVDNVKSLTDDLLTTVQRNNAEAKQAAEESIANLLAEGLISEEDAKAAIQELEKSYADQEKLVRDNQAEILKILKKAKEEGRKLSAEDNKKIQKLLTESNNETTKIISQGASDSTEIYEMLEENRGKMSKQMLSQAIQYANDEYDATVRAAQDTYDASIANANRLYNDLGVIDAAEYERIKTEAEEKKKIQIDEARKTKEALIKEAQEAAGGVADAVDPETGEILSNWELIWNSMFEEMSDAWEAIKLAVKNGLNDMIGFINTPIASLNSLSSTLGGQAIFGSVMPTFTLPTIPYLAKGAVLPPNKPFMAVVGDQTHGTNVEAPLSTIQEAVAIVMEDVIQSNIAGHEATVAVLREILEAVLGIHIGDDVIGEAVARYNAKMAVIRGGA